MKFAMNYSPQAAELLQQGFIDIDYFKTTPSLGLLEHTHLPNLLEEAKKYKETVCHFAINTNSGDSKMVTQEWIQQSLDASSSIHINTHLNASLATYGNEDEAKKTKPY